MLARPFVKASPATRATSRVSKPLSPSRSLALGNQARLARLRRKLENRADGEIAEGRARRFPDGAGAARASSLPIDSIGAGRDAETPAISGQAAPFVVQEALNSPGAPLAGSTRNWFEPRFGRDLSSVRVHADRSAEAAASAVGARAFAVGRDIVFGRGEHQPDSRAGRRLLAHELAHVLQQNPGAPTLRRALAASGPVPLGSLEITGQPEEAQKGQLGNHESVEITFTPKPYPDSPETSKINFIQIASSPEMQTGQPFTPLNPNDRIKDSAMTTAGAANHLTVAGETAETVSTVHFGDPSHASAILRANRGKLTWWMARQTPAQDPASPTPTPSEDAWLATLATRPLPVGTVLSIPDAVKGGFVVDIDPTDTSGAVKQPRAAKTDPNLSPEYPWMKREMQPGGFFGASYGFNRAGASHPATMTDRPGGGPISGKFIFESAARAEDLGVTYGAVKWGFNYGYNGISGEWATISTEVSDTLKAGLVSFNKTYKNNHIAQQGDTLNKLSVQYFGDVSQAQTIYIRNKAVLKTNDGDAPIPPGTAIDVGVGPRMGWPSPAPGP